MEINFSLPILFIFSVQENICRGRGITCMKHWLGEIFVFAQTVRIELDLPQGAQLSIFSYWKIRRVAPP